jgi:hypothetical protein
VTATPLRCPSSATPLAASHAFRCAWLQGHAGSSHTWDVDVPPLPTVEADACGYPTPGGPCVLSAHPATQHRAGVTPHLTEQEFRARFEPSPGPVRAQDDAELLERFTVDGTEVEVYGDLDGHARLMLSDAAETTVANLTESEARRVAFALLRAVRPAGDVVIGPPVVQSSSVELITLRAALDVYERLLTLHHAPCAERSDGLVEAALDDLLRSFDEHGFARRREVRLPPAAEVITIDTVREVPE